MREKGVRLRAKQRSRCRKWSWTSCIGVIVWYSGLFSPDYYDRLLLARIKPLLVLPMLAGACCVAKKSYRTSNPGAIAVRNQHICAA